MSTETAAAPKTHAFQAEVSRLLHLMVHSVYSDKEIFLRELISNAADACEKLRFLMQSDPGLSDTDRLAVTLSADPAAGTLTVADNGIGMDEADLVEHLGTIARSGTRAFLDRLGDKPEGSRLIGQFGVGFYSAFMVAERVDVVSRKAGTDTAHRWSSDGLGSFTIETVAPADAPAHGTSITLHLNAESKTYADRATIERIVQAWSAHVPVPVDIIDAEGKTDSLTDGSALWAKPKASIAASDYTEFYRSVAGAWDEPAEVIHYRAEGRHEYSVLLFVPSMKPFDLFDPDRKGRVKLYVRRVFITDEADILPAYLRFVKGVVDSEDLPLNLSREMLQSNPVLDAIRKAVTGRVLTDLAKLSDKEPETFLKVWDGFGPVIKEGLYEDYERRDELFRLARFKTSTSGDSWRSLADYVKDMKEGQGKIFYVTADTPARAAASPHLEGFRARGVEVLLLSDPVDAFWVRTALGFEGKPFQSVTQGAADLDAIAPVEGAAADTPETEGSAGSAAVIAAVKAALGDRVADVRASRRLADSAVCLVAPDHGPDRQFEKIMARHQGGAGARAILEINARHGLITAFARRIGAGESAADMAEVLFGQARILDGDAPDDPAAYAKALDRLLASA